MFQPIRLAPPAPPRARRRTARLLSCRRLAPEETMLDVASIASHLLPSRSSAWAATGHAAVLCFLLSCRRPTPEEAELDAALVARVRLRGASPAPAPSDSSGRATTRHAPALACAGQDARRQVQGQHAAAPSPRRMPHRASAAAFRGRVQEKGTKGHYVAEGNEGASQQMSPAN